MKKRYLILVIYLIANFWVYGQVGIGTNDPKATLHVNALQAKGQTTNTDGILIPRVDRERALSMENVLESTLIYIDDISTGDSNSLINSPGFYYYKNNNSQTNWIKLGSEYAKPEFFYMPSVVLPTYALDELIVNDPLAYKVINGVYEVNLFVLFSRQFTQPIASSPEKINENSNEIKFEKDKLNQFINIATDYHYYITYADQAVFTDIKVNNNGVLSYKVNPDIVIKNGSFMNAVLKIK